MSLCTIPGNPDIAGIGVRIAIYIQNLLCLPQLYGRSGMAKSRRKNWTPQRPRRTTNLVLALAILISYIVQALTLGLSNYHANIVLSMSWMNNTNAFIYFLLYIHHKRHLVRARLGVVVWRTARRFGIPGHKENGSTEALDSRGRHSAKVLVKRFVILLGSLHLSLMAALGIWLWINLFLFRESRIR
ncbi:hypothetical protein BKA70DRAFT_1509900 [Coprinopsis sp. MPI-PUGE-AT-0042]|nr:hypothetical protein BKA70DRAFT_1509900 [Coprinopsis sp. MPI-PUGE-AT-0042]